MLIETHQRQRSDDWIDIPVLLRGHPRVGHVFSFVVVEPVVLLVRVRPRVERHEQGRVRYVTDDAVDEVVVRKRLVPVIRVEHDVSNCLPIHEIIN